MSSARRVPLAAVPNAANSPLRHLPVPIPPKRARTSADDGHVHPGSHSLQDANGAIVHPPPKRHHTATGPGLTERDTDAAGRPSGSVAASVATGYHGRPVYPGLAPASVSHITLRPHTAPRRFDSAAYEQTTTARAVSNNQSGGTIACRALNADSGLEDIRQWQRHYRKAFQQYVFYFDALPHEQRTRLTRQIRQLGSREEMFFSKSVTHVVTSRPIPPPLDRSNPQPSHADGHSTINPNLLHGAESSRLTIRLRGVDEPSRIHGTSAVLTRAREFGIKIWALEKVQRMMATMFDTQITEQATAAIDGTRSARTADLTQMLQNEKSQANRDLNDLALFRGYFVYVHDQDEKTRPIIVRDYGKPPCKEEGQWPQFRLTGPGRCPFVEDYYERRAYRIAQERAAASRTVTAEHAIKPKPPSPRNESIETAEAQASTTTVTAALTLTPSLAKTASMATVATAAAPIEALSAPTAASGAPVTSVIPPPTTDVVGLSGPITGTAPDVVPKKRPATDDPPAPPAQRLRRSARVLMANALQEAAATRTSTGPPPPPLRSQETLRLLGTVRTIKMTEDAVSYQVPPPPPFSVSVPTKGASRMIRGEPVASGIQPSAITSAIRSQMVSSAAGVGARGGTSKEVNQLQRKVLVQSTGGASASASIAGPSPPVTESKTATAHMTREMPPPRAAKLKAQETLCQKQRAVAATQARKPATKKKAEPDGKAGYCENCQDKFTSFRVHVTTRKHRQFAVTTDNWRELDSLLGLLQSAPASS